MRVLIEGLREGQNQDKWAALHYAVLSSHAEMPETEEGNPSPEENVEKNTISGYEIPQMAK